MVGRKGEEVKIKGKKHIRYEYEETIGTTVYYYYKNKLHREDDGPAIIYPDKTGEWYKYGLLHRENGPAYVDLVTHDAYWYKNGIIHRLDGPAVQRSLVNEWFLDGVKHRTDGPAIEYKDGRKEWYLYGDIYAEIDFNRRINEER